MIPNAQVRSCRIGAAALLLASLVAGPVLGQEPVNVTIEGFRYQPDLITIKVGDRVRWQNREKRQFHNVWFEQLGEQEPEYLFPGDSYERKFEQAGTFPYRCGPHPEMTGVVKVEPR